MASQAGANKKVQQPIELIGENMETVLLPLGEGVRDGILNVLLWRKLRLVKRLIFTVVGLI